MHNINNKGKSILVNGNRNEQRGSIMCRYCNGNELIYDQINVCTTVTIWPNIAFAASELI